MDKLRASAPPSAPAGWTTRGSGAVLGRPLDPPMVWHATIWFVRGTVAVVLVFAASSKIVNPSGLAGTLRADHVPEQLIPVATIFIALAELAVAGLLIITRAIRLPLLCASALFVLFVAQLAYLKSQGIYSCNCLAGFFEYEASASVLSTQMGVNASVAVLCAGLGMWGPKLSAGVAHDTPRSNAA